MEEIEELGECSLCGRFRPLTFHHLIPRTCHANKWFKKNFSRDTLRAGIDLCEDCHSYLHSEFSSKDLGRYLNTRELLLADEKVYRFAEWVGRR